MAARHHSEAQHIKGLIKQAEAEIAEIDRKVQIAHRRCDELDWEREARGWPPCMISREYNHLISDLTRRRQEKQEDIVQWHKQLFDF